VPIIWFIVNADQTQIELSILVSSPTSFQKFRRSLSKLLKVILPKTGQAMVNNVKDAIICNKQPVDYLSV